MRAGPGEVIRFWFDEVGADGWYRASEALDRDIERRYGELLRAAAAAECAAWRDTDAGRLAEIIVLDQFSRNVYRNTPAAFASDPLALALAQEAVRAGVPERLEPRRSAFLLMPYMHSESRAVHAEAEPLFAAHTSASTLDYERRHQAIIDRFGRYPHRNAVLGRESTAEELAFLQQPGSGF